MSTPPRQRFSVRLGHAPAPAETLYEGVPRHLLAPLQGWVSLQFDAYHGLPEEAGDTVCIRLRAEVPRGVSARKWLSSWEGMELLDAVDEILRYRAELRYGWSPDLIRMLDDAGSAYRVSEDGSCLEERVAPAVAAAADATIKEAAAVSSAGSASEHLQAAWQAAYGLRPDPVRAYSEAIKAVESAAHSVIQPNHARATLGTMLGEIGNARTKFATAIVTVSGGDPIAPVEAMMRALWDGQTSRHGKQTPTAPETLEAARAGVHLAAALVQWFTSGAVTRNP